jgi:hypothetical protein
MFSLLTRIFPDWLLLVLLGKGLGTLFILALA